MTYHNSPTARIDTPFGPATVRAHAADRVMIGHDDPDTYATVNRVLYSAYLIIHPAGYYRAQSVAKYGRDRITPEVARERLMHAAATARARVHRARMLADHGHKTEAREPRRSDPSRPAHSGGSASRRVVRGTARGKGNA